MSERRIAAAAVILLCVVYVKLSAPALFQAAAPALRTALGAEEFALPLSEDTLAWLRWD